MSNRFPARGGRDASTAGAQRTAKSFTASSVIARSACRFEYVERPPGLSRYQFETACLLQARLKPPFVETGHLVIQDRHGAAIWWWDQAALGAPSAVGRTQPRRVLPESVGQHLPDGWYHLRLEDGFEARHIERGMVIGSAWRRQSFGQSDWQAFVRGEGGALVGPCVPPSIMDATSLPVMARIGGGRVLLRAVSWKERAALAAALLAVVLGGWWHGAAHRQLEAASSARAETDRLDKLIASYDLFVAARKERARLLAAQTAAGSGTAGIRFAAVLRMAAARQLQVIELKLDSSELAVTLRTDASVNGLRALAGELEALPHFSQVTARNGARAGEMQLDAKVVSS